MRFYKSSSTISLGIAFFLIMTFCVSGEAQRKKRRQSGRPSITLAKIYRDIVGKVVEGVTWEETGSNPVNWTFEANEAREIEILEKKFVGDNAYVVIHMYTQNAAPDRNGLTGRLKGNLRLQFDRIAGDWLLTKVENLTFRYTVYNSSGRAVTRNNAEARTPSTIPIVSGSFTIGAGQHRYYRFVVSNRAIVTGRFRAQGGGGNDIEVFILDEDAYENFRNGHGTPTYYNSGKVTVGTIRANLGAGAYYLVFNNGYSIITNKAVEAYVGFQNE
jgi:hypothetical protein